MKRLLFYGLILAVVWVLPIERLDVAQLQPVEVIAIYPQGDQVILTTDTGDIGSGTDAMAALENMQQTSTGVIYLDTAEYLLFAPGTETEVEALRSELKDRVKICNVSQPIDLEDAAKYLPIHGDLPCLRQWQPGQILPILTVENSRLIMLKNMEKDT